MTGAPFVLAPVTVTDVTVVSPSYVRVEFGAPELAELGVEGPWYDQRIKLVFPPPSGALPDLSGAGDDWYARWLALPEHERGAMRTYSVLDVRGSGAGTRLLVDFVLHLAPGATGPASTWASRATPGDQVLLLGPRRGHPSSGIEFDPGDATQLLLAADETAVPALSRILADLPAGAAGTAFCEVPCEADVRHLDAPAAVDVRWLPRAGADVGGELIAQVLHHLGAPASASLDGPSDMQDDGTNVWETPRFSAAGQDLRSTGEGIPGLYAWIAGESRVVTTLRRHLVGDVGLDRSQIAFMGYWRKGVAMRG